jgi:superfamily I DNA and/or RNA helicase
VPSSVEEYFDRLTSLLELESQAEARQVAERVRTLPPAEAEAAGHSLVDLLCHDTYAGLGGRCLLVLGKRNREQRLPWTRLGPGTPVVLTVQGERSGQGYRGVVVERESTAVRVAFDDPPDEDGPGTGFRLDIAPDEAARLRQRQALQRARTARRDRLAELRGVLLGERLPEFVPLPDDAPLDPSLNPSQRQAVCFALSAKDVAVLHGPPGTGKTTTVVELIRRAVRQKQRVLVCAPSNLGVDNVLERLLAWGENAVRLGHPARVLPALRAHTLDLLVEEHSDARQARKLVKEAFALFRKAGKWTRARPEPGARQQLRQEARSLLADARQLEARAVERILDSAPILCATTTGLDDDLIGSRRFDLLVIEEACQSTEPGCWPALNRADRVVLAGDHCQLPPTVLSNEAARRGLGVSLLERLVREHGERITRRLDVQYRMHEQIMAFSSAEFYDGTLQADASVRGHLLCEVPGVATTPLTTAPVTFLDTAGAGYEEEQEPDEASRFNPQEADLATAKVRALLEAGVRPDDIAVITPYSAQVRRLRAMLKDLEGLEIDSVDGFQGREKEVVVLSLVRSNREGEIGFLADVRRTNVALTRARRGLIVIGDSGTLSVLPFYQRFCDYVERISAHRTVWEEV